MDLQTELDIKTEELRTCVKKLRTTGTEFAEAERAYQVKKAEVALRLRDEGMSVGLIELTIKGHKEVAPLMFKRDVAGVLYDANKDAVQSAKLQMRLIENQIQREWGQAGNE